MKKLVALLLALTMVFTMTLTVASADSGKAKKGASAVLEANPTKEQQKLIKMVDQANKKIEQFVAKAQKTPVNDIEWLLKQVEKTTKPVYEYADEIGATVDCRLEYFWIDGEYIGIDPLYVVNLGKSKGGND